jgi:predicted nucleotidyltransferase
MLDIRSKTRRRLLTYYFTNPTARVHVRELAAALGVDASNLSKEVARLVREGLFTTEMSGHQKYVALNPRYPLLKEVRSIVTKTIGAPTVIADALSGVRGIAEAYLYGSFARNQQDAASDIDILIIGAPKAAELALAVERLERQLGREISYTVLSPAELRSRRARKDTFIENVWHNKRVPLAVTREEAKAS